MPELPEVETVARQLDPLVAGRRVRRLVIHDPKLGDPNDWPYGHGPQEDAIRIDNHVRCVCGAD